MNHWKIGALILSFGAATACASNQKEPDGPAEEAGEKVDETAEDAKEGAKEAGEKIEEKAGEAKDAVDEKGEEVKKDLEDEKKK